MLLWSSASRSLTSLENLLAGLQVNFKDFIITQRLKLFTVTTVRGSYSVSNQQGILGHLVDFDKT